MTSGHQAPLRRRKVKLVFPKYHDPDGEWAKMNGQALALDDALPEDRFQAICEEVAQAYGWTVYHETDSRMSPKGLPDLIMLSPVQESGAVVLAMIELKSAKGKLTVEQGVWQTKLERVTTVVTGTLRPADWPALVALLFDPLSSTTEPVAEPAAPKETPDE